MKHLKTYESIDNILNIKKYVMWKVGQVIVIMEVISVNKEDIDCTRLFIHNGHYLTPYDKTDKSNQYNFEIDEAKRHIIYTSDDIEEIMNIIKTEGVSDIINRIKNTDKYNL